MKLIVALRSSSNSPQGKFWQALEEDDKLVILFGAVGSKPNRREVPRSTCSEGSVEREAWNRANKKMKEGYERDPNASPVPVKAANRASTDNRVYLSGTVKRTRLGPFWRTLEQVQALGLFSTPLEFQDGKGREVVAGGSLSVIATAATMVSNGQEVTASASIKGGGAFSLAGARLSASIAKVDFDELPTKVVMQIWSRCLEDDATAVHKGQEVDVEEVFHSEPLPSSDELSAIAIELGLKPAPINTAALAKAGVRQALVF